MKLLLLLSFLLLAAVGYGQDCNCKPSRDTVKAVILYYESGPSPIQKRVFLARKKTFPARMAGAEIYFTATQREDWSYMDVVSYLDTDRKTKLTFKYVWQTAFIEW